VTVAYALMALPAGFAWWVVVWFAASSMFATLSPLADVIVLARARRDGFNFGWPRGIGSAGFVVGNVGMGALLARGSPELVLVWMVAAVSLTALGARLLLPPDPVHEEGHSPALSDRMAGIGGPAARSGVHDRGSVLRPDPVGARLLLRLLDARLEAAGHSGEHHRPALGETGVATEIGFMWFMEPLRRRAGPRNLLVIGGAAAVLRWTALGVLTAALAAVPAADACMRSAMRRPFLASLQLVERLSTPRNASTAQSMNSALSGGVLSGLATMASGPLFDRYGSSGYLLMSAMCIVGLDRRRKALRGDGA